MNPYNVFDRRFAWMLVTALVAAVAVVTMFGYVIDIFTRSVQ